MSTQSNPGSYQEIESPVREMTSSGGQTIRGKECQTPKKEKGVCVAIKECKLLSDINDNRQKTPEVVSFLQTSICGYDGNNPKVCCPHDASDESGERLRPSKLPALEACGKRPLYDALTEVYHVVRGQDSELGDWPWIAALGFSRVDNPGLIEFRCGGTLITDQHVLTAAHCFRDKSVKLKSVRLGDLNLFSEKDGASPMEVEVDSVFPHEEYSNSKKINDIAIVKLRRSVSFTPFVRPICLPLPGYATRPDYVDRYLHIAGWGSTGYKFPASATLQDAKIKVVSEAFCKNAYREVHNMIDRRVLCAGNDVDNSSDSCQGDSGGPLMDKEDSFIQIGIISYGASCGETGYPGVYTKLSVYVDWIKKIVDGF